MVNEKDQTKTDDHYYFTVWNKYEEIAMHFNDLIIRLRIQSIGGIAALATILGVVLKTSDTENCNYLLAFFATLCLSLFWVAIWILDLRYYNRLLEGSVQAILEIEKNKKSFLENENIILSSCIEDAFGKRFDHEPKGWKRRVFNSRNGFYLVVFVALLVLLSATIFMHCQGSSLNESPSTNCTKITENQKK